MVGDTLSNVRQLPSESVLAIGLISGSQFVSHMYLVLLPPILTILSGDFSITVALLRVALGIQALTNTVVQLPFDYFADQYDVAVAFYAVAAVAVLATVLILAMVPRLDGESRPVPLTGE